MVAPPLEVGEKRDKKKHHVAKPVTETCCVCVCVLLSILLPTYLHAACASCAASLAVVSALALLSLAVASLASLTHPQPTTKAYGYVRSSAPTQKRQPIPTTPSTHSFEEGPFRDLRRPPLRQSRRIRIIATLTLIAFRGLS